MKRLRPREDQIHVTVAELIRLHVMPDVVWLHVPNGEDRHPAVAAKLKRMGVLPGVADLMFIIPRVGTCFLELKRPGHKPSTAQLGFKEAVTAAGCLWEWVDNVEDAAKTLTQWGAIKRPSFLKGKAA